MVKNVDSKVRRQMIAAAYNRKRCARIRQHLLATGALTTDDRGEYWRAVNAVARRNKHEA